MIMVKAIVRPDKKDEVLKELADAGFNAVTVVDVVGRGKQKGIKIGGIVYDEIPKALVMLVAEDGDKNNIIEVVLRAARTSVEGAFGDGKIFVSPVEAAYTISSGVQGL